MKELKDITMTENINHEADLEKEIDLKNVDIKKEVDQVIEKGQEVDPETEKGQEVDPETEKGQEVQQVIEKDRGVNQTRGEKEAFRPQKVNYTILISSDRNWTEFSFGLKIL